MSDDLAEAAGRELQLRALEITYPGWDFECVQENGRLSWSARLRGEVTPRHRAAGVLQVVTLDSCPGLTAVLAMQQALIWQLRARVDCAGSPEPPAGRA